MLYAFCTFYHNFLGAERNQKISNNDCIIVKDVIDANNVREISDQAMLWNIRNMTSLTMIRLPFMKTKSAILLLSIFRVEARFF